MTDLIGARHPTMQRLRRLARRRSARLDEGAFVIEGSTLVREAMQVAVTDVVAEPACPADVIEAARATGAALWHVAAGALARVSDTVTPQPVAAIARIPQVSLADAVAVAGPLALVLVGVGDPGNAGTLLRSAEAAGARAVVFCDGSTDPFGPKCVRSSAGSLFRLAIVRDAGADHALGALRAAGVATVATVARGGVPYDRCDLVRPVALVLGSEAHGLAEELVAQLDEQLTIPMLGRTESLNVGMAGTILCFESLRQRRAVAAGERNQLDETPPEAAGCTTT